MDEKKHDEFSQNAQRQDSTPPPISGIGSQLTPQLPITNTPPAQIREAPMAATSPTHSKLKKYLAEMEKELCSDVDMAEHKSAVPQSGGATQQQLAATNNDDSDSKMADLSGSTGSQSAGAAAKHGYKFRSRYAYPTYSGVLHQTQMTMPTSTLTDVIHFAADNFGSAKKICELVSIQLLSLGVYISFMCAVRQSHVYSQIQGDYHYHAMIYLKKRFHTTTSKWLILRDVLKPHVKNYPRRVC